MRGLRQGGLETALSIALVMCASIGLDAKGPTVKLTITAPLTYTVRFDVQPPQNKPVRTAYAVSVARDARTGALWLYLPGRGEPGYALNVGTILRDGQDGHWHRPPLSWATAIAKFIP